MYCFWVRRVVLLVSIPFKLFCTVNWYYGTDSFGYPPWYWATHRLHHAQCLQKSQQMFNKFSNSTLPWIAVSFHYIVTITSHWWLRWPWNEWEYSQAQHFTSYIHAHMAAQNQSPCCVMIIKHLYFRGFSECTYILLHIADLYMLRWCDNKAYLLLLFFMVSVYIATQYPTAQSLMATLK